MIIDYLKLRFPLLRFLILSILLSLFVVDADIPYALASALGVVFLILITLLLFRLLDDAGSIHFDKNDAERKYLDFGNFRWFLSVNAVFASFYFGFLAFLKFSYGWHLFALYIGSALLYLAFHKYRIVVEILPFLKYPLLFYVLGVEDYRILIVPVLIFITYDLLEEKKWYWLGLGGVFVCGMLCLFNLGNWLSILYVVAPVIIAVLLRNHKYLKYLPIIYFPIVYFVVNFLN